MIIEIDEGHVIVCDECGYEGDEVFGSKEEAEESLDNDDSLFSVIEDGTGKMHACDDCR